MSGLLNDSNIAKDLSATDHQTPAINFADMLARITNHFVSMLVLAGLIFGFPVVLCLIWADDDDDLAVGVIEEEEDDDFK
ncbi:hypothetical protein QYF36_009450 [Acer negundo]|nr:hypothetical protein QYF36_009450 [Acer negundo]